MDSDSSNVSSNILPINALSGIMKYFSSFISLFLSTSSLSSRLAALFHRQLTFEKPYELGLRVWTVEPGDPSSNFVAADKWLYHFASALKLPGYSDFICKVGMMRVK